MTRPLASLSWGVGMIALVAGCATEPIQTTRTLPMGTSSSLTVVEGATSSTTATTKDDGPYRVQKGTGVFLKPSPPKAPDGAVSAGPGVTLNFENADLREVVRNILGDVLNVSYVIDPQVQGTVTIRTAREIPRTALMSTLETMLRMNGHTVVEEGGIYKVQPAATAVRGNVTPQLGGAGRPLPNGYSVVLLPLRYVGVREMLRVLEPFAKDAQAIRPDELRNMLILSGTERELSHLLAIVDMFDVDWIAGMSVGLFTLQSADVKQVSQEIDRIFGDRNTSPMTGIIRVVPIERMNALLVISPQPAYVEEAKKWIERLDKAGEGAGQRLYVYFMKNGRADRLAPLLQQALTGRVTQQFPAPTLAPGETATYLSGAPIGILQQPLLPGGQPVTPGTLPITAPGTVTPMVQPSQPGLTTPVPTTPGVTPAPAATGAVAGTTGAAVPGASRVVTAPGTQLARGAVTPPTGGAAAAGDGGVGIARNVQIVADKDQNSLLIVATPSEYALIETALKKLDIAPRQVMIEVTIVEVLLKDEFRFGVEWYFTAGADVRGVLGGANIAGSASNLFASGTTSSALNTRSGFNIAWQNLGFPGGIQAVLNMLAQNSKTKVVSNPHVLATDNQKASIKVGDRIPIDTQSYIPGTATTSVVTTTTQYLDTGILVNVTPKINAGGLVTLDLAAEVSDPGPRASTTSAPPINSRSAQTLVTVQSGETMVLAGLIRENRGNSTDGLPFLSEIPVLGALFGTQDFTNNRTELVLFITPRVVESNADMRQVTEELRRKMEWVDVDQLIPRRTQ